MRDSKLDAIKMYDQCTRDTERTPCRHNMLGSTVVPNAPLRDARLSFKARGILAYLLLVEGERVTVDILAKAGGCGRDSVLTGLRELREAGYLEFVTVRDADGRIERTDYVVRTAR